MSRVLKQSSRIIDELRAGRQVVVDECLQGEGCNRVYTETGGKKKCIAYAFPQAKWRISRCVLASNVTDEERVQQTVKVRVGQQKQKKKSRRK